MAALWTKVSASSCPVNAVTSYGAQGKTVDYVLFSDSTVKAATNAQQWYVTISRGRRGVRIFTPDNLGKILRYEPTKAPRIGAS